MDDLKHWKVERFIKKAKEVREVNEFMEGQLWAIKNLQVNLQCESLTYPGISSLAISSFCAAVGLIDHSFSAADANRLFIASTTDVDKTDEEK